MNKEGKLFVVSFYEGLQRVALFTTDRRVYKLVCDSEKMEVAQQEISILLQNIGVSLVNNTNSQEVAFIGITRYHLLSDGREVTLTIKHFCGGVGHILIFCVLTV